MKKAAEPRLLQVRRVNVRRLHSQHQWFTCSPARRGRCSRPFAGRQMGHRAIAGVALPVQAAANRRWRAETTDERQYQPQLGALVPDAKRILFTADEPGKGVRFYVYELATGKSVAISQEGVNGTAFSLSPDSRQIAAIGPDQRGYLYPVAGGDPRPIAGFNQGEQPITWNADGRSLYISQPGELPARVYRLDMHRTAHALERTDALRSRWRRKHRPHLHDSRRQDLRLRLPPHAGRSVPGRRLEIDRPSGIS